MGYEFGYVRVRSTNDEPYKIQKIEKIINAPSRIYVDIVGEKLAHFGHLRECIAAGDCVWIYSLDDLGDSLIDVIHRWEQLREAQVNIRVVDMPNIETDKYQDEILDLISNVLSTAFYLEEKERDNASKTLIKGKVGRPKIEIPEEFSTYYGRWIMGEITARDGQRALGIKPNTWYRMVKDYEAISELPFV